MVLFFRIPARRSRTELETVVSWARHAEKLAYDDYEEMLYQEPSASLVADQTENDTCDRR